MGIRCMSKEKEEHLIEIEVDSRGCIEGIYECYGRFDTTHKYSCGFKPDDGWYRIADYSVLKLKTFHKSNIPIRYSETCEYLKSIVEEEQMKAGGKNENI